MRYGGRQKGSKNKVNLNAQERAEELGVDPLEILLMIAKGDVEGLGYDKDSMGISLDLRMKAAQEVMQYILPKRKAVEHTGVVNLELSKKAEEFAQLPRDEQIRLAEAEVLRLKGSIG